MTVAFVEQPTTNLISFSVSPTRKRVRRESLQRLSHNTPFLTKTETTLRSCLKTSRNSLQTAQLDDENVNNLSLQLRKNKRSCRRVCWNNVSLVAPPSPCEHRDPSLWWRSQDRRTRRLVDQHCAVSSAKAQSYERQCRAARTTTAAAATAAVDHPYAAPNTNNKRAEIRLKRVFLRDLLPGYLEGFRGMESAGGPLGGGHERMDAIRAYVQQVVDAQQSCSSQQELAMTIAATTNTSTDRCWARLLALGDELVVKAMWSRDEPVSSNNSPRARPQ